MRLQLVKKIPIINKNVGFGNNKNACILKIQQNMVKE